MASSSNRETPVDFASLVDNMSKALEQSTSAAGALPDKSDMGFHRTLDRKFAKGMDATSARVLNLTNKLLGLAVQDPSADAKADGKGTGKTSRRAIDDEDVVVDHFRSSVIDIVDTLLENADSNLDEANGQKKKAAIEVKPSALAQASKKLPGPAGIQNALPAHLAHDRDLTKPQLFFQEPVNTSNDQPSWTPTLPIKHHAMVPITWQPTEADMPVYVEGSCVKPERRERDRRLRYHPYYYETMHLPYPTSMFTATPPIVPSSFEDTPFEFVDTPERLEALTEVLKQSTEIAVDLEANSTRSYYGLTCLMQISTRHGDWIVDTLALRHELRQHKLGGVFADPAVVKVFHGAMSDIEWLQRDFDIYVVNLFDTYHASKVLEFPQFSLASLLKLYCDFDADKKYQLADWRIRPIPDEMMFYARADTHFLLYIYDNLRNALIARASRTPSPAVEGEEGSGASTPKPNPQRAIREVLDQSAETALKLYSQEPYDHEKGLGMNGWNGMIKKFPKKDLNTEVTFVFKRLHFWRDTVARELDESPHHVFPNYLLIDFSQHRPKNPVAVARKLSRAPLVAHRSDEVLEIIRTACLDYGAGKHGITMTSPTESSTARATKGKQSPSSTRGNTVNELPSSKRAKTSGMTVEDWSSLVGGKAKGATTTKAAVSSLFGGSVNSKPPVTSSAQTASTAKQSAQSSLFGSTMSRGTIAIATEQPNHKTRRQSPGFAAVQAAIHGELAPIVTADTGDDATPVEPNTKSLSPESASGVLNPESVEFIPAAKRKNAGSDLNVSSNATNQATTVATTATTVTATPRPALVNGEGIVSVKKSKNQKKKRGAVAAVGGSATSSAVQSEAPSPSNPVDEPATDGKKQKKVPIQPGQIPDFDYSAEPNLLDDPSVATRAKKTKGRKDKKDQKKKKPTDGIDTSAFRRPPSDPSQPKSGSRSGTFTR